MLLGFIPISFRFRGKTHRLNNIYNCFQDNDSKALHPTQISRLTGLSINEVNSCLKKTPELFIRIPRRPDGITRYRLTTTTMALGQEKVEKLLRHQENKESAILYAFSAIIILLIIVVAIIVGPRV